MTVARKKLERIRTVVGLTTVTVFAVQIGAFCAGMLMLPFPPAFIGPLINTLAVVGIIGALFILATSED